MCFLLHVTFLQLPQSPLVSLQPVASVAEPSEDESKVWFQIPNIANNDPFYLCALFTQIKLVLLPWMMILIGSSCIPGESQGVALERRKHEVEVAWT